MTDAEAPLLWPHDAKSWLTGKDPDTGKDRGQKKGTTEHEMVGWHHWLSGQVWVNSGSGWWTGRPGMLRSMGSPIVGQGWATEQQWERYLTKLRISIKKNPEVMRKNQYNWLYRKCNKRIEKLTRGAPSRYSFHRRNKWKWGKVKWEYTAWGTKGEKQERKRREVQRSVRKH